MAKRRGYKYKEPFRAEPRVVPADVKEAMEIAEEIQRVIDEDVKEYAKVKALDFFESVGDKAASISKTIERTNRVSEGQREALENSLEAVRKWVHDED